MKAEEARKIAENGDNSLKEILFGIKAIARTGGIKYTFDTTCHIFRDYEHAELEKLGYIIEIQDKYVIIKW